ncbi:hypothetical protein FCV25MIE_10946 [Fagus crenata]
MRNPTGILFGDLREVLRLRGRGEERGDALELTASGIDFCGDFGSVASAFGLVCSSSSSSSSLSEFAMDLANHDIVVVDPYGLCSQLPMLAFFTGIRILNVKKMCGGEVENSKEK